MSAEDNLSPKQFENVQFHLDSRRKGTEQEEHYMWATHPDADDHMRLVDGAIGRLSWFGNDGEIAGVEVHPQYRRQGLATEMFRRAKEITPGLHHSRTLSSDGRAWAEKTR